MPKSAKALADEAMQYWKRADSEGRDLTPQERLEVSELVIQSKTQNEIDQGAKGLEELLGSGFSPPAGDAVGGAPGDRFVASEGFKSIADPGSRPQKWSTGMVEISTGPLLRSKGTLLEGAGAPGSGSGGGFIAAPQVIPGVVSKLFEPVSVVTLLPTGQATTSSIRYMVEGTATSGAVGVAEGGAKPQSTIGVSTTDEPVKKIATSIKASDELFEDAVSVQSYVNSRLSLFVQLEEERQLLRGSGTNELVGFFNRSIPVYAGGTAAGNKAVQLFKAAMGVRAGAPISTSTGSCFRRATGRKSVC
jgi:HK97 family phage major capsid protein